MSDEKKSSSKTPWLVLAGVAAAFFFFGKGGGLSNLNESFNNNQEENPAVEVNQDEVNYDENYQEESYVEEVYQEPPTEQLIYIEITVDENSYIYQNTRYSVEEVGNLVDLLNQGSRYPVHLTDYYSSEKAYNTLRDALRANDYEIFE